MVSRLRLRLLLLLAASQVMPMSSASSVQQPSYTELSLSGRRVRVESREHNGTAYLRLRDLRPLGLVLAEPESGRVRVAGPEGAVNLRLGSSLVRERSQLTLLSAPVRRWDGHWFVPRDFVERVAVALLGKVGVVVEDRRGPRLIRSGPLEVEVLPDRVELRIRLDQSFEPEVSEEERWLSVGLPAAGVPDRALAVPPNNVLSAIIPVPGSSSPELRLVKGPALTHFDWNRDGRNRLVLVLYGPTGGVVGAGRDDLRSLPPTPGGVELPSTCAIVLDPGHGGSDTGASRGGVAEKTLALELALDVQQRLRRQGICSRVLRRRDVALGLEQRSAAANHLRPRLVISLHVDSARLPGPVAYLHSSTVTSTGRGPSSLPNWDDAQLPHRVASRLLAAQLLEELARVTGHPGRTVLAPLALIAPIDSPAVLLQVGSVATDTGRQQLRDAAAGGQLADAISTGIIRFLRTSAAR